MKQPLKHWKPLLAALLYTTSAGFPVWADDIDILIGANGGNTGTPANILFIVDTSGSMGKLPGGKETTTDDPNAKINVVKKVFKDILYDPQKQKTNITIGDTTTTSIDAFTANPINPNFEGKNFALMRFDKGDGSGNQGGSFLTNFLTLDSKNKNDAKTLFSKVWGLSAGSYTPLAETLYEATLFYLGNTPEFGETANPANVSDVTTTDPSTKVKSYISPFAPTTGGGKKATSCSTVNHVVLLTDGAPYGDDSADTLLSKLKNYKSGVCGTAVDGDNSGSDNCLPNLADYLYMHDFDNDTTNGVQNVMTHTIAFDLKDTSALQLLKDTSTKGHGMALTADDPMQLTTAVEQIISSIQVESLGFSMPAVSINSNNKYTHNSTMYFSMFKPEATPRWKGNMKGYKIQNDILVDFSTPVKTVLDDGVINDGVQSKWSTTADGPDVLAGGVADINNSLRKVVTYLGTDSNLTAAVNTIHENNADITTALLGITTTPAAAAATERDNWLKWARGLDVLDEDGDGITNESRHIYGDPLHSQPALVDFDDGIGGKNTYMFFGTNDSVLHAIDVASGEEKFAFIPANLLPNLGSLYDNIAPSTLKRPYGVDGSVTAAKINGDTYIFFGLRRGGSSYYALKVTDIDNPVLQWQINGGEAGTDFAEMAQTWSTPVIGKVKLGNTESVAMIVGGGYDAAAEDPAAVGATAAAPSSGRAVYIIDALTGSRLWVAQGSGTNGSGMTGTRTSSQLVIDDMGSSIPATIATLDVDLDGFTDRLYFADITGKVFRIDLNADKTELDGVTTTPNIPNGGLIADLRGTGAANQRRFYNEVEIVFTKYASKNYLSLNVGSGYRAAPKDTSISDEFYSVRDDSPYNIPDSYSKISVTDLVDASTSPSMSAILNSTKSGWYFPMKGLGEKVLADSYTLNNYLMFTSYTPPDPSATNTNACQPAIGTAKLYAVNLFDGKVLLAKELSTAGIPPSPAPIFLDEGANKNPGIKILVGMEPISDLPIEAILTKAPTWTTNPEN